MPIKPHKNEDQSAWMARCVPEMIGTGKDKRPQAQAVAACMTIWRESGSSKTARQIEAEVEAPYPDETEQEFMDRCTLEADEADCQMMWDERSFGLGVVHKLHSEIPVGHDFVLSDATVDRYGDTIDADGWDLRNFSKNPIALFNHNPDFPVGKWSKLGVKDGRLTGRLELAPEGTSARHDEIRRLVDAGILRAVSVGFKPVEVKPIESKGGKNGLHYLKSELIETSLVSVPANPNALQVARSLRISDDTIKMVFAEHGDSRFVRRGANGEHAGTKPVVKAKVRAMTPIAKRIEASEATLVQYRDELEKHLGTMDDTNPDETVTAQVEEWTEKVKAQERSLNALRAVEAQNAETITLQRTGTSNGVTHFADGSSSAQAASARPFAMARKQIRPVEYLYKALTVQLKHFDQRGRRSIYDVMQETYGEDPMVKTMVDWTTRTTSVPATTTVTGWAAELVTTSYGEFFDALFPASIYAPLRAKGGSFTFGRSGVVVLPTRSRTAPISGAFVLQGSAIPVKQGQFATISLTPKKMAVISTFTREISEHSTPAIEQLIRDAIVNDTAVAIDAVLMDANPATATRPAGILNGVAAIPATTGGGIVSLIGDLKALSSALLASTFGGIRQPVWIMTPQDAVAISLTQAAAGGDFPFANILNTGMLLGYPVIQSTNVTADTIILVDAADFATATGDTPNFSVSDQATLHMEATTPAEIVGTPSVVAAPVRSLWQTDSIGIRMIMDINWVLRRVGMVQWISGQLWN
jgi:HK97 family phage prohead protease